MRLSSTGASGTRMNHPHRPHRSVSTMPSNHGPSAAMAGISGGAHELVDGRKLLAKREEEGACVLVKVVEVPETQRRDRKDERQRVMLYIPPSKAAGSLSPAAH